MFIFSQILNWKCLITARLFWLVKSVFSSRLLTFAGIPKQNCELTVVMFESRDLLKFKWNISSSIKHHKLGVWCLLVNELAWPMRMLSALYMFFTLLQDRPAIQLYQPGARSRNRGTSGDGQAGDKKGERDANTQEKEEEWSKTTTMVLRKNPGPIQAI